MAFGFYFLITDSFTQIRYGFRFAPFHIPAIPIPGRYVFIDTIIPLYQLGKAKVAEFPVGFWAADTDL